MPLGDSTRPGEVGGSDTGSNQVLRDQENRESGIPEVRQVQKVITTK